MKQKGLLILLVSLFIFSGCNLFNNGTKDEVCVKESTKLRSTMLAHWQDHITYLRNFIISSLAHLEDKDAIHKRFLKNQEDIGNEFKPFYGEQAGNELTRLLKEHEAIGGDIIKAAMVQNKQLVEENKAKWRANADQIAQFISGLNPYWSMHEIKDMMYIHLDTTDGQLTSRLKKDWNGDIAAFDEGHKHMVEFANILTSGIIKQFPDKFKCYCNTK
ncbi:MAG: glycosyltransferase [Candidatus Babeliales bacterium]